MSDELTLYEAIYIVVVTLEEEVQQDVPTAVESAIAEAAGQLESTLLFGRRRLAYEIDGHAEGLYMISYFRGTGDTVQHLYREFGVLEAIVRGTVVAANPAALYREPKPVSEAPAPAEEVAEQASEQPVPQPAATEPATPEPAAETAAQESAAPAEEPIPAPTTDDEAQAEESTETEPTEPAEPAQ